MAVKVKSCKENVLVTLEIEENSGRYEDKRITLRRIKKKNIMGPSSRTSGVWLYEESIKLQMQSGITLHGKIVYFNLIKSQERGYDIIIPEADYQKMYAKVINFDLERTITNLRGTKLTYGHKESSHDFGIRVLLTYRCPLMNFTLPKTKIEISLEFAEAFDMKQNLQSSLIQSRFLPELQDKIKIISEGQSFTFDKMLLCTYSDVFKTMLENPNNKEALDCTIEIEDFSAKVINTFHRILFTSENTVKKEDFSVKLMMFAHKYNIKPLFNICRNNLMDSISMDNIYDTIKAAYFIDDDDLMLSASRFVTNNKGQFAHDNDEWSEFQKLHPQCFVRIMNLIMFNDSIEKETPTVPDDDKSDKNISVVKSEFQIAENRKELSLTVTSQFQALVNRRNEMLRRRAEIQIE